METSEVRIPCRTGMLVAATLVCLLAKDVVAQVTVTYRLPDTTFAGWGNDPCGTIDRGVSTAGTVDTGAWTDLMPAGTTVGSCTITMMSVYDATGAGSTFRINGVVFGTIFPFGGAACGNDGNITVVATPATYNLSASNAITLTNNGASWNIFDRNDATFGYMQLAITMTLPANTSVWVGDVSADWNTAGNWYPVGVPTAATNVLVPLPQVGTSSALIAGRAFNTGGVPTLSAAGTCNNLTIPAGRTVNLGANTLTVNGNFTNNGTITGGTGNLQFDGATAAAISGVGTFTLNNVVVNKTGVGVTTAVSMTVSGNFTVQGTAQFVATAGMITMSGGTVATIANTSTAAAPQLTFFDLTMNKTAGINVTSTDNWTVAGDYTNTNGNLVCTAGTVTLTGTAARGLAVNGGSVQFNNLTVNMSAGIGRNHTAGNFNVIGNYLCNGGTFNSTAGTITFDGTVAASIEHTSAGSTTFNNLTINKTAAVTVTVNQTAGTLTVAGNLVNMGSSLFIPNTGTLNINGSITNTGPATWSSTTGTVWMAGGGVATFTTTGPLTFVNLTIDATKTVDLGANNASVVGNLTNNGTLTATTGILQFDGTAAATYGGTGGSTVFDLVINKTAATVTCTTGNITINRSFINQLSSTFNATAGTITYAGGTVGAIANTSTAAAPQLTFFNFILNKSAGINVTSTDNWTVAGDYTNTLGNLVCTAGTVTLRGTANRAMALNGGTVQFNNLTINQDAATTRTWTTGTALLSFLGILDNAGAGNFTVTPLWTMTGADSDLLRNSGAGATTFSALTVNKTAAAASVTTEVTAGSMTVTGDFTNTGSGTFGTTTGTFSVNGNLAQTGAALLSSTGGTFRFGGAGASTVTNTSTGSITFFSFQIDKSAAVSVTTTNSFTVTGAYTNSGSGNFAANQGVENPWQTFQNGTIVVGDGLDYTMGYRFTILVNGRITKLGGRFAGTKLITLWNAATQTVVAQASVVGIDSAFTYSSIPPVNVSVGEQYIVSVYLAGTGGTHREAINTLPRTYGAITIEESRFSIGNVYPTTLDLTAMWGQVDIEMQALPTLTMAGAGAGVVNHTSTGATTFANLTVNKPVGVNVTSTDNWAVTGNVRSIGAGGLVCTGGTVTMSGSSQIIDGVAAPQFNNLTIGAGSTTTPTRNVNVGGTLLVNGTWRMTGAQTLTIGTAAAAGAVTVGGTINCSGTTPTITAAAAGFPMTFNVNGSINVSRLNFSRGDAAGMNLVAGSTVVALNNAAFTSATVGGRHLTINNAVVGTFTACSFDNTYGLSPPGFNVRVNNAGANVTMANWSGNGGGEAFDEDFLGIVTWESSPPNAPTNLMAEQSINPINVLDSRPEFQATFTDPDVVDTAPSYQLQVSTDSTFATVSHWDSGWVNFGTPLANGASIVAPGENYGGTFMTWAVQYFWRIRFRDNNLVVGAWSATANFTMGVPSVTLPNNGWNMVGVPRFDNASVASVFGDDIPGVVVYEWNETARSWQQTLTVQPGRGYMIFSSASFVDTDTGTARWGNLTISNLGYTTLAAPTQYETVANQFRGWHVISHPFTGTDFVPPGVDWTSIWAGSTNLGDVYQYWNGTSYVWYDAFPPTDGGAGNRVLAWRGIWVNVLSATNTIVIPNPKNPASPGEPAFDANYWRLQIQVDSAGAKDISNYAGVRGNASNGYDTGEVKDLGSLANPYATAYFDHNADWPATPDRYTQQMNQTPFTAGAQTRFPLTVDQNTASLVTLSFPNFAQMPTSDWGYQLEDMDTFQFYTITNGFTLGYTPATAGQKRFDIIATRLTSFSSTLTCTTGPQNPSAGTVGATQNDVVMLQMRMAAANEGITVDQIRVRTSGSGNDATMISGARLYHDVNRNGALDAGDTLISGPNVFAADNGSILWWNLNWGIPVNNSEDWLVVYDFNAPSTNGGTFRAWFDPATDVQGHGGSSTLLVFGSGTTVSGPDKTVPDGLPPVAPVLVSPANGAWLPNGAPAFDWSDVADAVSYYFQMDNNPDFSSPEVSVAGLASSSYSQPTSLPMGTWYWRVYAVDSGSNVGPWSGTWSFLVAPAPRSEVSLGLGAGGGGQFADFDDGVASYAFLAMRSVPWSSYAAQPTGGQTHVSQGDLDGDGLEEIVVGFSNYGGGWLCVEQSLTGGRAVVRWIRVPWAAYNTAAGMTWPACGNVDADPRSEIVVGLGPYPAAGGWFCVFDDGQAANALLGWKRLPLPAYNAANGEVRPATGDVDGDGRDEVVLGLGASGAGRIAVMEDWQAGMGLRSWIQIPWAAYNTANGSTWVAAGDADADGRAEVVAGLGTGGGGKLAVFDDGAAGHAFQSWVQVPWSVYNAGRGETRPAMGNVDSDPREELMVGLGPTAQGWWVAMGNAQDGFAVRRWNRVPWAAYDTANGETWPSVGDGGGN